MSKERGVCIHYRYEGCCDLGKNCEFWGHCQTCPSHRPKKGASIRKDYRSKKKNDIYKKELNDYVKFV